MTGGFLSDGVRISLGAGELVYRKSGRGVEYGWQGVVVVQSGPFKGRRFPVGDKCVVIGR